jgi:hypothetical protein
MPVFLRVYLSMSQAKYYIALLKKKKPFVETKGSNDCLPYERAKVK